VIISHQWRFVLLATWKSASSTLHLRLGALNESPYPRSYYFNPFLNRIVNQHITYAEFEQLPEARMGYRGAAFVRNPYDRFYSGFRQLRRDVRLQPCAPFPEPWIREKVLLELAKNRAQLARANYDINEWVCGITEDQILDAGANATFPLHPAHYWTHSEGSQRVDFIGRVEDFDSDYARFRAEVGISVADLREGNANAANNIRRPDPATGYRHAHLLDRYSIEKINAVMALDFALFGYHRL